MRGKVVLCVLLFLIPIFSVQSVSAQPDFEFGDWEIGFKEGENITKELDEDGEESIEFWVRNDYLLNIDISFNFDSAFGAETNEIDSTSVSAGGNESFVLEFSDVDVLKYRAEKRESFSITVTIDSYGGLPSAGDEKTISGELTIPRVRGFELKISDLGGAMNAGTDLDINIEIQNTGNDMDSTTEPIFESKACPQLDISNINSLEGIAIDAPLEGQSGKKTIVVTISAPSSHPSKNCDLKIGLKSLGAVNNDDNGVSAEDEITFEVRKPNNSNSNLGDGDSDSETNNEENDIVSRNFTPGFSLITAIVGILCAIIGLKRE